MTQPPDDAALVAILLVRADTDREYGHNARASEYIKAATALEAKDRRIAEMREAIQSALQCTPQARETPSGAAVVIYDCGDPWAILRAALEPSDKGVG